jgi:hypothetical protein
MSASSFDQRLAEALSLDVDTETLDRLDRMVEARLTRRSISRRRGWRIALVVATIALSIPIIGTATAGIRDTEGPFGYVDATGFQAEIDAAKEVVPLPAGAAWPAFLKAQDPIGGYSRNGGRFWVEQVAFCLWMDSWTTAVDTSDRASAKVARDTLLSVPTWTLYTSPFADQSYRDVLDLSLAGVLAGDTTAARGASRPACP